MLGWKILAVLLFLSGIFAAGYETGNKSANNASVAAQDKAAKAAQVAIDAETARRDKIGVQREVAREQIRVVYRTIKEKADEQIKTHPNYADCGLDAIGLQLWNAANQGTNIEASPLPSELTGAVSSTPTSGIGAGGRSVEESH